MVLQGFQFYGEGDVISTLVYSRFVTLAAENGFENIVLRLCR